MDLINRMSANRERAGQCAATPVSSVPGMASPPPTFRERKKEIIEKKPGRKVVIKFFEELVEALNESSSEDET